MNTKVLWAAVGVLAAAVIGVAAWKAWPLLNPKVVASAPLDAACDLNTGPCASPLPGGGKVTFTITPAPIRPMQPLTLAATVEGREVHGLEADFQGVEMNMGFNRARLEGEAGRYNGSTMLPVCVRDAMEWEARLLIRTDAGLIDAPFRFITRRDYGDAS